jgi:diguanylate cyclase (GGDEF)-like protein
MKKFQFNPYEALKSLVEVTAPHTGDDFFKAVCHQLKHLFKADLVFITRVLKRQPTITVKVLYSTSNTIPKPFVLNKTPCKLVYDNKIISINENVRLNFEKEKDTNYESYYGIPLNNSKHECTGHIAIFSQHKRTYEKELEDIALLFARRIETETKRLFLERKNEQIRRRLERLSIIDSLTQTYNRRFFTQKCEEVFNQLQRENINASIIYLDLDDFKHINDNFGHAMGDFVLKSLGRILKRETRKGLDFVARLGGEEFGILCLYSTKKEASLLVHRIQEATKIFFHTQKYTITASFGISAFNPSCQRWEEVLAKADENMYIAKKKGKNTLEL